MYVRYGTCSIGSLQAAMLYLYVSERILMKVRDRCSLISINEVVFMKMKKKTSNPKLTQSFVIVKIKFYFFE